MRDSADVRAGEARLELDGAQEERNRFGRVRDTHQRLRLLGQKPGIRRARRHRRVEVGGLRPCRRARNRRSPSSRGSAARAPARRRCATLGRQFAARARAWRSPAACAYRRAAFFAASSRYGTARSYSCPSSKCSAISAAVSACTAKLRASSPPPADDGKSRAAWDSAGGREHRDRARAGTRYSTVDRSVREARAHPRP